MESKVGLEDLLRRRGKEIVKYSNSLIGENLRKHILAEEIVNETVRYALEHPEQLANRSEDKLFRFLLWKAKMIVIDKARDLLDREPNADIKNLMSENIVHSEEKIQPSPSFLVHRRDKRVSLRRLIDLLPNNDRKTALYLVRIEGLSVNEAAKRMDKSPEAVRKLAERGFVDLVRRVRDSGAWKFATSGPTT